jgi:hypothetical protein
MSEVTVFWTQVLQNKIRENNKIYINARWWTYLLLQNTITLRTPTQVHGAETDIDNNSSVIKSLQR